MPEAAARLGARWSRRRAFITGAGSGLGLALATELAKAGWTIGRFDREAQRLAETAPALKAAGGSVYDYLGDVTNEAALAAALDSFTGTNGGLDLMVNNAGVAAAGRIETTPAEDWRWILEINVVAVATGSRLALPHLKAAPDGGAVVNIASAAGFAAPPLMGAYNASKAAVISLTETLAAELGGTNVNALAVMPTFFQTRLLDTARAGTKEMATARRWMETSNFTAEACAKAILEAVVAGKFHLALPADSRWMWRLKRLLPAYFVSRLRKGGGRSTRRT
jgi:NAD(P)-dependent dehydrogenase (short-subunit alcohol dehydrogenase family)